MRHADDDRLDAEGGGLIDDVLHARNHHLDTLKTETLLRAVLLGQEALESGRTRNSSQQKTLLVVAHLESARSLQTLTNPVDLKSFKFDDVSF